MRIFSILIFSLFSHFINAQNECVNHIKGTIINNNSKEIVAEVKVSLVYKGETIETVYSDSTGSFSFANLTCDSRYRIVCIKENFAKSVKLIFTVGIPNKNHDVAVKLIPIDEFTYNDGVKKIVAKNITFYPDSYDLTPEAVVTLERIKKILLKYDKLKIEIDFHTDSRGGAKFLMELSQKRADVCLNYLASNGVDSSRIVAKGLGATKLLNRCKKDVKCSQSEHLINRRSEFIIVP